MSSPEPAVVLRNVGVCYRLLRERRPTVKDFALRWLTGGLAYESLWALRNVSLTVRRGECVGIEGRNGAGKTTLLKVISGVLRPSEGECRSEGRVTALLELAASFDPELTGMENVYLTALLRGHPRREIGARLAEITAFSELAEFMSVPTRQYSLGMRARLGFAIAVAWPPEVLLLDEVLAVGDSEFGARCRERLTEMRSAGQTQLIVSHDHAALAAICGRCVRLSGGRLPDEELHPVARGAARL